jgi:diaminopimelate decarboxylase
VLDDLNLASAGAAARLRVAIVGLGPKGMFALERVLDHAGRSGSPPTLEVDAYEPHPVAGAGPVYDPGQPDHLRMNFAAGLIDAWWPGSGAVPPADRRSFVAWCDARGHPCDPDAYPPRADVGRYLADCLRTLLAHAPPNVVVTVHAARVHAIDRVGSAWALTSGLGPRADLPAARHYDEVLIATGHDRTCDDALATDWSGPAPLVPAVFPVDRWLSAGRVPPGSVVAIRGFALSFIDAALALTEGRGGCFEPREGEQCDCSEEVDGTLAPPASRLRYHASGAEPAVILPFSRSGRPMLAKPAAGLRRAIPGLDAIADQGRRRIAGVGGVLALRRDLLPILAQTAAANLNTAGADTPAGSVDAWFALAVAGDRPPAHAGPADELAGSLEVGCGVAAPDLAWALGQTWRGLYPAIVTRLGGDGLAAADWPAFRRLAAELERLAFGPPPINAAKLLALVDAGLVDLAHVRGGRVVRDRDRTRLRSVRGDRTVDVVIDAVLPGPGARPAQNALLGRLLADGQIRVAAGRRGVEVDADGSALRADGTPTRGLAAIGRPTEDSVIGNDTLSRTLHPVSDRWARRVVERARRRSARAAAPVLVGVQVPVAGERR